VTDGGRLIPVSVEFLIDAGLANPLDYAWQARQDADREARWRALPRRTRFMRTHVWPRWYKVRGRVVHAARALRGIECERDD
jgi:hypothetical protein